MPQTKDFTVFVIEDDDWYAEFLTYHLSLRPEIRVERYATGKEALSNLYKQPVFVTLDFRLPGENGDVLLKKIKEYDPSIEVVVISEQGDIETAIGLMKAGAFDYLVKSDEIPDKLQKVITLLMENRSLRSEVRQLREEVSRKYDFQNLIIGDSPPMQKIFRQMERTISTNITVMVSGETGTGKELVAKSIHYNSKRSKGPFVEVNMAAIPLELAESELFGHVKGAFTGAITSRKGKFVEANGGTLFLDEIGEAEPAIQVKLLRALQERVVVPVGADQPIEFDCRIVAATHRNLAEEVKNGNFRQDLFYRLFGVQIDLPPLRDRGQDIITLAQHFIDAFCKENGMEPKTLTSGAKKKLLNYAFPGNIRELKSLSELACVMADGDKIDEDELNFGPDLGMDSMFMEGLTLKQYTHKIIRHYLDKYDQDIKTVASKLDIGQSTIYRMLKEEKD